MSEEAMNTMSENLIKIREDIAGLRADLKTALGYGRLIDIERRERERAHEDLVARVRKLEVESAALKVKMAGFCALAAVVGGAIAAAIVKAIAG